MEAFVGVIINMGIIKLTDAKSTGQCKPPPIYHFFIASSPETDSYKSIGCYTYMLVI